MKISKTELLHALEVVKPGLANKELIEQSTSFAFMGDRVVTYNDDISISHPIEGLELTGAVTAEKLYQLLGKLKEDQIDLKITDAEIILSSGRIKAGLTLQQEIKLPLEEEVTFREKWKKLPKGFIEAVRMAIGSCSKNTARPILTCVHVCKEGYTEASDSNRLIHIEMGEEMPIEDFLLPASAATVMIKMEPTAIAKGRGWIHFRTTEKTILSCRIFMDKYPETGNVLNVEGIKLELPVVLSEVLERAVIFAKRDHMLDETIEVTIDTNVIKIRGEADSGWFEETADVKYKGIPVTFYITPYLLKDILKKTTHGLLGENRLKFSGDNWQYIGLLKQKT